MDEERNGKSNALIRGHGADAPGGRPGHHAAVSLLPVAGIAKKFEPLLPIGFGGLLSISRPGWLTATEACWMPPRPGAAGGDAAKLPARRMSTPLRRRWPWPLPSVQGQMESLAVDIRCYRRVLASIRLAVSGIAPLVILLAWAMTDFDPLR